MSDIDSARLYAFRDYLLRWYESYGRHDLPWRHTDDPYRILVSEMMLQQTQVPRVIPKYHAFLERFPDVATLAASELPAVIALWQGLGYNRRAKFLHTAAQQIVERHDGCLPQSEEELLELYGIGPYTASAIQTFAFNIPVMVIETNVRTVFIHHFFPETTEVPDHELEPLIAAVVPEDAARTWYSALMDYGTVIKSEIGNVSQRSGMYQKQSPFEGSKRQVRGSVLRILSSARPAQDKSRFTYDELEQHIDGDVAYLAAVLRDLTAEEMITLHDTDAAHGGVYSL